ncbi:MAG: DUF4249 domain-containing protein [Bacteroidota bacterium]
MKQHLFYSLFLTLFFLVSCKEKYEPPAIKTDLGYLVVDGSLINGPDSTIIRLSRTKNLGANPASSGEQGAQMTVEDAAGNTVYNFTPVNDNGLYTVPGMNLDINKKYKLRINTTDGNQYVSDDVIVKETPSIDSVSWQRSNDGVIIYANTHDPQNSTKYYRWEYTETWDYYMNYFSQIKYQVTSTGEIKFPTRTTDELVYHCWKTVHSTEILLGSSSKLSQDIIILDPVRFIPVSSFEISSVYSILVKQYALTREAFEYFENIKKFSEQTGSLFDAQPSQLNSNIHCVGKPGELVIGFVAASSLQQQRIFITKQQVNPWNYSVYCPPERTVPPES